MQNLKIVTLVLLLFLINLSSCEKDPTEPSIENGTIIVHLTDAPADFDAVNITFSEIGAHIDSDWVTIDLQKDSTVNLLDWTNGKFMILGQSEVPAGHHTQVRLKIKAAEIIIDNETFPLEVPSGAQSGLKFGLNFAIHPGSTYELVLDFDACKSIFTTGPKNDPKSYKLKPHIRVISKAVSGAISGTVTNPEDMPVAYGRQNSDTTTSATVDTLNGFFMLSFLPEGSYTVSIEDTAGKAFHQENVTVNAGTTNDLGDITLQ
ncbi:MAG: DUF4382 domain-containing protein [bacterium]|jgi:hypothetical protein|nr:DUF4382 domain-containing protein [bacterium]